MAGVSYDTLSIRIEADSKQANASVKSLSANLQRLDDTAKKLDTERLGEVRGLLQDIANIDFSNVTNGLQSIVTAFSALNKSIDKTFSKNNITTNLVAPPKGTDIEENTNYISADNLNFDIGNAQTYEQALTTISATYTEINEKATELQAVQERMATPLERLEAKLLEAHLSATQIDRVFGAIKKTTDELSSAQLNAIETALKECGYSAEETASIISHLDSQTRKLESGAKKGAGGLSKLVTQFVRIAKYRIIRKIIQEIYRAITEGIQNIIAFDSATSDTIDRLGSKFLYLKDSIGALFAPLIQIVAPIIEQLLTLLGDLNNELAELFAGVNGQTQYAKAKDDLEAFNNEAKKTKALGIDELNVISQNQGSFTYEEVKLSQQQQDIADGIKKTIGELKRVLDEVFAVVKSIIDAVMPVMNRVMTPLLNTTSKILQLVTQLLDETVVSIGDSLADLTIAVGSITEFVDHIVTDLMPTLQIVITIVASVLNVINNLLGAIFNIVGLLFDNALTPIIDALLTVVVPALNMILVIVTAIVKGLEGVARTFEAVTRGDWGSIKGIWEDIKNDIAEAGAVWIENGDKNYTKLASYASGGFPEDGLFFANHNELIGRFYNGKTAVANNEEITEGIYQAVKEAMLESGGQSVSVNIDGYELAKIVTKQQNNFGADVIIGGNINWGK